MLINNRVAADRLLPAKAGLNLLGEIAQTRTSTHEQTVKLNRAVALLRQKQTKEAKEALAEVGRPEELGGVKDERVVELYAHLWKM